METLRITSKIVVVVCLLLKVFSNFEGIIQAIIYIIAFACCGILLYYDYKEGRLDFIIRKFKRK